MLNPSSGAITEYPLLPFTANPVIYQIVAGPDGNIYFTEPSLNEIGIFDIKTDLISQFTMPLADTQPQGITVGGDGNLWFTEGGQNKIGSLNPSTHVITNYAFEPPSYSTNTQAEGITAGPNDTIWFVEKQNNVIQEFDINAGAFTTSVAPYWPPKAGAPSGPANLWSIAEGADGNIYYTEPAYGWVGVYYISSAVSDRIYYPAPSPYDTASEANLNGALLANGLSGPYLFASSPAAGVVYDPNATSLVSEYPTTELPPVLDANYANDVISVGSDLWFTDPTDGYGEIGEFDPVTQTNTEYPVPPMTNPPQNQYPNQLTEDSNGNIWFTETNLNLIGEINPSNGQISQSFLTSNSSSPVGIVWDPAPQEEQFWMTEPTKNQIVSYNPATSGSAVAPIALTDPVDILVDPAEGYLWISEGSADKIVEYDPINEQVLYTFSTKASPNQLIWGPDGNIWFTETGYVGVLSPPTGPGTGSITAQIPVSWTGNYLSVGPSSGTYANTIWFTATGSNQIGEINVSTQTLVGYVKAADTNAVSITLGPDGNEWFTSGQGTPAWMGAVVLNPNDLGTQVVVTTGPPDVGVEETVFGGFIYGFGLVVSVENSAGQIDPFVQQGTITIAIDNDPGSGALGGTTTIDLSKVPLPVADGMAVFDGLTINSPGQGYTLQATYSLGLNAPVTSPFTVTGPATQLIVTTQPPSSVGAGTLFGLTIAAEDSNGFVVPSFDDAVSLSIVTNPPGNGVLNGTNPRGALYGTAAFNDLSIDQVGAGYTLQATDVSNLPPGDVPPTAITTKAFTVTAGPAAQLLFDTAGEPPGTATAGQNFASAAPIVVDAEDQFGNLDTTYSGAVTIVLANNATGTLTGTLTESAVKGVAKFSDIAIETAGTFELEATGTKLTAGTSTPITINPGTPALLIWAAQPSGNATAGFPFGATIDVEDKYDNLETGSTQSVTIGLDLNGKSDTSDLGGTDTIAAVAGVAAFSDLVINADGGPFTLVATSGDLTSAASSAITVAEPTLVVTSQPTGNVTAGNGFSITVQANTNVGGVDTAFTGTVLLSISSGPSGAAIQGTSSAPASSGVATFSNVLLDTAGTYVLEASSGKLTSATSSNITVVAQTAVSSLYIEQEPPASVEAGAGFGLVVGGEDHVRQCYRADRTGRRRHREEPRRRDAGRHHDSDRQQWRGDLQRPVPQRGRDRLHAHGHGQLGHFGDDQRDHRDGDHRLAARDPHR